MKDFMCGSFIMFVFLSIVWGTIELGKFILTNYGEPYITAYVLAVISMMIGMIFAISQQAEEKNNTGKSKNEDK